MGNNFRCCIGCILPCGALDVIRVLHVDGRIDVYGGNITAGEVIKANHGHVLSQPICENLVKKPRLLNPEEELQKGKIYFLIPSYALQPKSKPKVKLISSPKKVESQSQTASSPLVAFKPSIRTEKIRCRRRFDGRQRRDNAWKPELDSITESQ